MLLTEADGKQLLASVGIAIPAGIAISTAGDLTAVRNFPVAAKAQVMSGGRGLGGGVVRCDSAEQAAVAFSHIMNLRFGTEHPSGVLFEQWLPIRRELYLSVVVDGRAGGYTVLYAPEGGVGIETGPPPAAYRFGPPSAYRGHELRAVLEGVETDRRVIEQIIAFSRRLLRLAQARDCTTVEVNPLVVLDDGNLVAADAKIVLDEAAVFRQAGTRQHLDRARAAETDEIRRCLDANLMLVWLDGDVGLVSGGAGMTMGAMDAIDAAGGRAACFLDCSGNPTKAGFGLALELLDNNPGVRSILISMFGGGLQVDRVARTLVGLLQERGPGKPVVIRLDGTGGDEAQAVLTAAGLTGHRGLETAVQDAVRFARREAAV